VVRSRNAAGTGTQTLVAKREKNHGPDSLDRHPPEFEPRNWWGGIVDLSKERLATSKFEAAARIAVQVRVMSTHGTDQ